ncbi:MAG: hypothetical protein L0332_30920 [Chloroflexi bacterium]|nr:hypothetical protein [Chloroflexota bacterium]MCI0575466.1 hypothetical protein [Chloroflexota bacterium]MCI0648911.1 hypothetical protein [Chloroflexota bacterium]MCI0731113.1 hypothetical protein [Chloroflexota bacterium]
MHTLAKLDRPPESYLLRLWWREGQLWLTLRHVGTEEMHHFPGVAALMAHLEHFEEFPGEEIDPGGRVDPLPG